MTQACESKTDPVGPAPTERGLSVASAGVRDSTPVIALMRAGNDLATALDCGGCSERMIQQLVQTWESALFAVARDSGRQSDGGWDGRA